MLHLDVMIHEQKLADYYSVAIMHWTVSVHTSMGQYAYTFLRSLASQYENH